ncbi:MAG: colanic acid biosynthesis glycosyltransferase WcaL [Cyclobacteriaceae bacterium]|nr:MAG: colanic acid biosynthesis glycosyltransferase WcaL [Cyclobacteriaceae bacterium]
MKLAFFTDHPVKTSETFILELITGLEKVIGSDNLYHVAGDTKGKRVVSNTYFTNFSNQQKFQKLISNLEKAAGTNYHAAFRLKRRAAEKIFKRIFGQNNPDVAYFEFGQPAILFRRYLEHRNIPMVVHFHGMDASSAFNSKSYRLEIRKVFLYASYIITASHHIKRLLVLKGCPVEKIHVVRYGIRVAEIEPKPWDQRNQHHPSIIFLGRLTEKKNPMALIHAFNLVRSVVTNARLTIIGDGPLSKQVKQLVADLGLVDSVKFHGELSHQEAMTVLSDHWVFAQHSVTALNGDQEGYALSPAEAAAFELPVVSTLHNGIPEHVIDGTTGYLVREFDYESMAERIIQLLQDKHLAIKMGQNGRRNILELNDPEKRIESISRLLQLAYRSQKQ